ncbi:TPA: SPOR domain-containing protein [Clostridium perfringens]
MFNNNFKITKKEVERVEDTNPKLYAERCESELKSGNYQKAIFEIDKAIKFENRVNEKIIYISKRLEIAEIFERETDLVNYINKEVVFFVYNNKIKEFANIMCKYIKSEENRIFVFKNLFSNHVLRINSLIELSNIDTLKNTNILYKYLYENIEKITLENGLSDTIDGILSLSLKREEKINLINELKNLYKDNFLVFNGLISLGKENEVKRYIKSNLYNFIKRLGELKFINELRKVNIDDNIKKDYMKALLEKNKNSMNILDEVIYYYGNDVDAAIEYLDSIIDTLYKDYKKPGLIFLRKAILQRRKEEYSDSKFLLKTILKNSKKEDLCNEDIGKVLFNLCLVYCELATIRTPNLNYYLAKKAYKKSIEYGYKEPLPIDSKRDYSWSTVEFNFIFKVSLRLAIVIVAIIITISNIDFGYEKTSSRYESNRYNESFNQNVFNDVSEKIADNQEKVHENQYNSIKKNHSDNYNKDRKDESSITSAKESENNNYKHSNSYNEKSYNTNKNNEKSLNKVVYKIYSSANKNKNIAYNEVNELNKQGINASVIEEDGYYKVLIGSSNNLETAKSKCKSLSNKINREAYILGYDSDVEDILKTVKYYIDLGEFEEAKNELFKIKDKVNIPGYDRYKKQYNELYSMI